MERSEVISALDQVYASLWREWTAKEGAQSYPGYVHYLSAIVAEADSFRRARGPSDAPLDFLDVGLSAGVVGAVCSVLGMQVTGVDNQQSTHHPLYEPMRAKFGIAYADYDGLIDDLPFDDASFDIVNSNDMIEHIHGSPKKMLAECFRVLRPGGRLIVTTPNLGSLYNRVNLLAGGSVHASIQGWFHGKEWLRPRFTGHIREYTSHEVGWMVRESGFEDVRVRPFNVTPGSVTAPPADAAELDYTGYFAYLRNAPFNERRGRLRNLSDAAYFAHRVLTWPFPAMRRDVMAFGTKR